MAWNSQLIGKWWKMPLWFGRSLWRRITKKTYHKRKHQPHPFHVLFPEMLEKQKIRHNNLRKTFSTKKTGKIRTPPTNLDKYRQKKISWNFQQKLLRVRAQLLLWAPIFRRRPSALATKKSSHASRVSYLDFTQTRIWCPLPTTSVVMTVSFTFKFFVLTKQVYVAKRDWNI